MGFGIPSSCLKFFIKTCFELETDAIVIKVRGGASEGDVHGLDGSSPVFETLFLGVKTGRKYFGTEGLLPIVGEPACTEFNHEIGEGKHCEAFPVN